MKTHEKQPGILACAFKDPRLLSDGEIRAVLEKADALEAWIESVRDFALSAMLAGKRYDGWKIVEGRQARMFADDNSAAARMEAAGVDPYEKKLVSVAGAERLLGQKHFDSLLADLVVRQAGKPLLVPETDRRPEMIRET